MALPNDLGQGASGFHGDVAVRVRGVLAAAEVDSATLATVVANFNALLAKLDADAGVTDADYVSTLEVV